MTGSVDHFYYWTRDLDAAVAISTGVVGRAVVRREGDGWAELDAGSIRFALHEAHDGTQASGTVVFRIDDLEAARWALEQRGDTFDAHVGEVAGYARFATFRDRGGNASQIIGCTPAP
jgi:hypothetical protein